MRGRHILIGVTGGIAAYKTASLVRECIRAGAEVRVVMTEAAARFVTPLTFSTLSKSPVQTDLWAADQSSNSDISTRHIDLASWADVVVIAPASANTVAKLACGISDNLLTVVVLASPRPVVLAPTMDAEMYRNAITQKNLALLKERGYVVLAPEEGELASGLRGPGRLPEIDSILETIKKVLDRSDRDFTKKRILVTAGPTYEAIDPVRFVGNRSSGKMGFAIANAAAQRGAQVTLVAGPTHLETPRTVERIDVECAKDMLNAVVSHTKKIDALVMAAAVADYAPVHRADQKLKKHSRNGTLELELAATPDILATVGRRKKGMVLVGFALETERELAAAKEKLRKKNLDFIVLNAFNGENRVFGSEMNTVSLIDRRGNVESLPEMPKFDVANKILDKIKTLW
jgi:phosphopantothenoylcysteine decarboxylase/phosphopantothenate--cysteine ligase